ncbi:hypothetical protein [Nocardioides bruguierae]|uniref:Uncharacterized protein n=1 Tax=Nocardioides bruguierae TaxID=2945102 RepID=A0A9X2DAM6_9ACTN|nr:hypothetical protein [Nocardioides bruguierae]MCM0622421.1 hypothetical protein [Nocardioides bruguierae]
MPHPSMHDPNERNKAINEITAQSETGGPAPDGISSARAAWQAQPVGDRARKMTRWLLLGGAALILVSAILSVALVDGLSPRDLRDLTTVLFVVAAVRYAGLGCVAVAVVSYGVRLGIDSGKE